MKHVTREELVSLSAHAEFPSVSVYMPIPDPGLNPDQVRIQTKNLLSSVEKRLVAGGMPAPDAQAVLARAHAVQDDPRFRHSLNRGVALFLSPNVFHKAWLPVPPAEFCVVGTHFHLKPLIPSLDGEDRFYVLALSQKEVRLFEGSRFSIHELTPDLMPPNLNATLHSIREKQLLSHVSGSGANYYSQNSRPDVIEEELVHYFREIDAGIRAVAGSGQAPLLLACVTHLMPIYRQVNSYQHLMDEAIAGNPDEYTPMVLHDRAWHLVEPGLRRKFNAAMRRYEAHKDTRETSDKPLKVVTAAHKGHVSVLFVAVDRQCWGTFNAETCWADSHSEQASGDDDLLDLAAIEALRHGGIVYAVESAQMPTEAPIAAIFRY